MTFKENVNFYIDTNETFDDEPSMVFPLPSFRGVIKSATFTSTNTSYTSNATVTIPSGATSLKINCYGKGGDGGAGSTTTNNRGGGGGGGGGHARKTLSLSGNAGQNFNVVVNTSGAYVTSGTYTLTTVQGLSGQNGAAGTTVVGAGGTGGSASGGDTNVSGTTGTTGGISGGAGGGCDTGGSDPGGAGGSGGVDCATDGQNGTAPGGGGGGGRAQSTTACPPQTSGNGGTGAEARVVITFT